MSVQSGFARPISRIRGVLLALLILLPTTTAHALPVLVVSIDGLAYDLMIKHRARMPVLQRLAVGGQVNKLQSTFPTMTWAAHATMVTGLRPGEHGVVGNRWLDTSTGKPIEAWEVPTPIRARTIWQAAAEAKLKVAAIQWPNTSGERQITWNIPELYGSAFEHDISPPARQELAAIGYRPEDLKTFADEEAFLLDNQSRDIAIRLWQSQSPDLMLLHFLALDTVAHKYGPDHPAVAIAAEYDDRMLGEVVATAQAAARGKSLDIIVVSDHGFLPIDTWIKTSDLMSAAPLPSAAKVKLRALHNGHCAYLYGLSPEDVSAYSVWVTRKLPAVERVIGPREYRSFGLPEPIRDPDGRVPSAIVLARPNALFVSPFSKTQSKGGHGYLPSAPGLAAILVRNGPSFRAALPGAKDPEMTAVVGQIAQALGLGPFVPKALPGK